jgi:hypothetical protein
MRHLILLGAVLAMLRFPLAGMAAGTVVAHSETPAIVYLDGEQLGTTPMTVSKITPGDHEIRFESIDTHVTRAYHFHVAKTKPFNKEYNVSFVTHGTPPADIPAAPRPAPKVAARAATTPPRTGRSRPVPEIHRGVVPAQVPGPGAPFGGVPAPAVGPAVPGPRGAVPGLEVVSDVPAQLFLDGRLIGPTPALIGALPPGLHKVRAVALDTGVAASRTFDLAVEPLSRIQFQFVPPPPVGAVLAPPPVGTIYVGPRVIVGRPYYYPRHRRRWNRW